MKTPFRLDEHPRRRYPLAPPPATYFDQLPRRLMQRVTPAPSSPHEAQWGFSWLTALATPLRTALAATVVLGGFAGSFLLNDSTPTSSAATLATVSHPEMMEYLLASEQRVTLADLAELPATAQALPEIYLQASPAELQDLLDAQPSEDLYL